jgi:hypothetical protein
MTCKAQSRTLTLSRFAVEGTPSEQSHNRGPSSAEREEVGVRVRRQVGIFILQRSRLARAFLTLLAVLALATSGRAEEPDPAAIAKAKEAMAAAHSDKLAVQMLTLMEKPLSDLIESVNPGRGKETADLLREKLFPAMRERLPEFTDLAARIYAKHFTVADLEQLIAFYESPIGQKLVAEQPAMLAEMSAVAQAWGENLALDVMRKLEPEFQKRGLTMPNI